MADLIVTLDKHDKIDWGEENLIEASVLLTKSIPYLSPRFQMRTLAELEMQGKNVVANLHRANHIFGMRPQEN